MKSAMEGKEAQAGAVTAREQHEMFNRPVGNEPVTEDDLFRKWEEFVETLAERPNLKSTLSRKPVFKADGRMILALDNPLQEEMVRDIKPRLVAWLRRELRNSTLDLITEVTQEPVRKIAYTDGEKFEEMLKKNANLVLLKQKFNLDFDN